MSPPDPDRTSDPGASGDAEAVPTAALVEEIVLTHHARLGAMLPYVLALAMKVARVHGGRDRRLEGLEDVLRELEALLEAHLEQEDHRLFPALLAPAPDPAALARQLALVRDDHEAIRGLLDAIRAASQGFHVPDWGCGTYRTLMDHLAAIDADVRRLLGLEEDVLLPRFGAAAT